MGNIVELKKSKTGSSRRKGDEYQDLTALRLALELYIKHQKYQLYIEYEKAGNFDDIVVEQGNHINAYQVKYAVNPNDVYILEDFTDPKSKVYFKKFSDSWVSLKKQRGVLNITLYLLTNRALDAELSGIITDDGYFEQKFIEGKVYKHPREMRKTLQRITQLNDDDFENFLKSFRFQIKRPSLNELAQFIQGNLLDHELGISDRNIYHTLKSIIEDFALNRHEAITPQLLDDIFKKIQREYLLPQRFEVDKNVFIKRESLDAKLDAAIQKIDGDYIIVSGLPGIGKSTSLTAYFDEREDVLKDIVIRYYCFVDINDNFQKRRLEAKSLRVNLLSIFQNRFGNLLNRRFDYNEKTFYEALYILGKSFHKKKQKLIIFLDGLDHAERMETQIQETLLNSLPVSVPKGVVIVVGTQELHSWPLFLEKSRENPETHISCPPFTFAQSKEYLVYRRDLRDLSEKQILEAHRKSEGLPIYLRYIAEKVGETGNIAGELTNFPKIPERNIKSYYEILWKEFERKGNVRHLCGVLACLRFPVHKCGLFCFQKVIKRPDFDDCFNMITHLLRQRGELVEIFHNSFREFVLSKLNNGWIADIYLDITDHLKSQEGSDLWFSYVFEYAYRAKDYDYVLNKVNREFVDFALMRYRPDKDVKNAIDWAVESAKTKSELIALSRLGALKNRTNERLEQNLNRKLLSRALITLERWEDVVRYSYSLYHNQWLVDLSGALTILMELPNQYRRDIGEELFEIFRTSFVGKELKNEADLLNYASCLGIYTQSPVDSLKWLSQIRLEQGVDENTLPYSPGYAPHLERFLTSLVRYQPDECWKKIKKTKKLFPTQLIHYTLIRPIATYKSKSILRKEIEEYIASFNPTSNPELAFYAAFSGLKAGIVAKLLKDIPISTFQAPDPLHHNDPSLHNYRNIFFASGYQNSGVPNQQIENILKTKSSWWSSYLLYLFQAGKCVGLHWAQAQKEWFNLALDALEILIQIKAGERERIIELIELCREEMYSSLFWLTKSIVERYPNRLKEWFDKLKSLQNSKMWTTHYGVMESIRDYTFELKIFERMSSIQECRIHVFELLEICEKKFKDTTLLKGDSRSNHLLRLASIAARCGFKEKAEEWLQYGIKSTLIYGYHKDTTLFQLIDIVEMLNKSKTDKALNRCADILEMVKWMPHLTDGDITKHLPGDIYEQVTRLNENAAIRLLHIYAEKKSRWQMQDCLEILIKDIKSFSGISPELAWSLTSIFANHSDDGTHAEQVISSKQHIVKILRKGGNLKLLEKFKKRLDFFIRTNITPRHWAKVSSEFWQPPFIVPEEENTHTNHVKSDKSKPKTFKLEGKELSLEEVEANLSQSFSAYKDNWRMLEEENENFYESDLRDSILDFHISNAVSIESLVSIKEYLCSMSKWNRSNQFRKLGHRLLNSGDINNGFECMEIAYSNSSSTWNRWIENRGDLETITKYEKRRALKLVIEEAYQSLKKYDGYDVPGLIASALDVWGDVEKLNTVYEDYFHHCRELFHQLPGEEDYTWLKEYSPEKDNFNELAVSFLINQLDTLEIDLRNRLIDSCRLLCLEAPGISLPIFFERLSEENYLIKDRLMTILYLVGLEKPSLINPYLNYLFEILDSKHFQWKMMAVKMLQLLEKKGEISEKVKQKLNSVMQGYFSIIDCSPFQLLNIGPSRKFSDFFKKYVAKSSRKQIDACCEILSIEANYIITKIENCFKKEVWTEGAELERIEDEWRGHVHPQGFPGIMISTTYDSKVFYFFNIILLEIIGMSQISSDQLNALWQILQPVDPEYRLSDIEPRPEDIDHLFVTEKEQWLSALDERRNKTIHKPISEKWVTLFEQRIQSHDQKYDVPYRSHLFSHSCLIKKGLSFSFEELGDRASFILTFRNFSESGNITLSDAREMIKYQPHIDSPSGYDCMPILTIKGNENPLFLGYRKVVTIPYYLIKRYGLLFKGFDLYEGDRCMINYQVWQEGYEDENYSRELLSHGTRLRINRDLLERIFQDYRVELCQYILEQRVHKNKYEQNRTEKINSDTIVLIHN